MRGNRHEANHKQGIRKVQKYKAEKAKGHILLLDTVRFICEANGYDAEKIGQHFLEILPKICPKEE